MPVSNQKNAQITFALDDGQGNVAFLTLPIKPEDLTRTEPSRTTAVSSLDGAWIDAFGRGLATLTISGNTGWGQGQRPSGISKFLELRDNFIHKWHEHRRALYDKGDDPDKVRLIFIDEINGPYVADVVPMTFVLRRNKNQPLLLLYNITLTVTNDKAVQPVNQDDGSFDRLENKRLASIPKPTEMASAAKSLSGAVGALRSMQASLGTALSNVNGFVSGVRDTIKQTVMPVMEMANEVIQTANSAKSVINAASQGVINIASDLSGVASTVLGAAASVASIPAYAKSEILRAKSEFTNINCVLQNGFANAMQSPVDFSAVYGSSAASEMTGGRPSSALGGSVFSALNTITNTGQNGDSVAYQTNTGNLFLQTPGADTITSTGSDGQSVTYQTNTGNLFLPNPARAYNSVFTSTGEDGSTTTTQSNFGSLFLNANASQAVSDLKSYDIVPEVNQTYLSNKLEAIRLGVSFD